MIVFLGITLFLDQIKLLLDSNYYEGLGVVPYILVANMLLGIYYNLSLWYKLTDKTYFGAYLSIIGAIVTVVINSLFLSFYGYKVAAIAQVICFATMIFGSYYYMKKYYPIDYDIKRIASTGVLAFVIFYLGQFFPSVNTILGFVLRGMLILVFMIIAFYPEVKNVLIKQKK